jgi:glycerol-3-phosphate dehydrogenase
MPEPGWLDVAGGKLTTCRLIGQQAVDRLLRHLGRPAAPCRTAEEPLLASDMAAPIIGILPPPVDAEVVRHFCRHEWALLLGDVMVRRSGWHYYHRNSAEIAEQAAGWMAETLGWDHSRQQAELARYAAQHRADGGGSSG